MPLLTKTNGVVSQPAGQRSRSKVRAVMTMPSNPTPPPTGGTVTQDMIDFATDWRNLAEPTHFAMAMDPAMQAEMQLLTGTLATRAGCTHVAVQDGDWSAASTWLKVADDTFEVPTANAKVGIPAGVTVTMDLNSNTAIDTIRCDGTLTWATDQDTKIVYDTMVFGHGSTLRIGTAAAPLSSSYTALIECADNGDIDTSVDTLLIGRGIVTMGGVEICGHAIEPWYKMTSDLSAGATSLTLSGSAHGWVVGDEIAIGSTEHRFTRWNGTETIWEEPDVEHVTITGVSGATITFSPAITAARTIPTVPDMSEIGFYVANFTRNIQFYSPSGTLRHRRGHLMFMHDNVDIRWASSNLMGRTLKGGIADDDMVDGEVAYSFPATLDVARIGEMGADINWSATSNVQGRYSWHLHRAGTGPGKLTANMEGLAATDAPGWLYAHHSSIANFKKCVGRRFNGAGLVAEVGDEVGTWSDCLMMHATNGDPNRNVHNIEKRRVGNAASKYVGAVDQGRNGSGFWARSRVVGMLRCVAQDCVAGFVWLSRGIDSSPRADRTPEPRVFYGYEAVLVRPGSDAPIITQVQECFVANAVEGFIVIKANPRQRHELRTHLLKNVCWNVRVGFHVQYTGLYTFTKNKTHGIEIKIPGKEADEGFHAGSNTHNIVYVGNMVRGWHTAGVRLEFENQFGNSASTEFFSKVVDMDVPAGVDAIDPRTFEEPLYVENDDSILKIGARSDFDDNPPLTFTPSAEPVFDGGSVRRLHFTGTIADEAGNRTRGLINDSNNDISYDQVLLLLDRDGYWTYNGNDYMLVPDLISRQFADDTTDVIQTKYLTVIFRITNQNLSNFTNNGALAQRYVDAILIGAGTPPGSPDPNAAAWVVYEDILA